ncbi:MAG: FtsQ-type POTRA domain-containing protein [Erysipelotrichaceae bacterium]|nr:FtsQ-type POTRA domain-containing protein [Erysipelotrichaceae bacterium]
MKKPKMPDPSKWSLRKTLVICIVGMCLAGGLIYLFSEETRIQAISCTGNYYLSTSQIYKAAGLDGSLRTWQTPAFAVEAALKKNPLIESAKVTMDGQKMKIEVQEKMIIGLYVKGKDDQTQDQQTADQEGQESEKKEQNSLPADQNILVTREGEFIPVEDASQMKSLIHFPLMADLSQEQITRICKEYQSYPDQLTREVQEKVAEIVPWQESYDDQMVKMVMQDGNMVFSSIGSLHMLYRYQDMLDKLEGENVCLVLDGEDNVIQKKACDYMFMSSEERELYHQQVQNNLDQEKQEEQNSSQNQTSSAADSQAQSQEKQTQEKQTQEADDWESCQYSWLMYSPSLNIYQDKWGTNQYRFDENTQSFIQLN